MLSIRRRLRMFATAAAAVIGVAPFVADQAAAQSQSCKVTGIISGSITTAVPAGALSTTAQNLVSATINVTFAAANGVGTNCGVVVQISGLLKSTAGGLTIPYSIAATAPTTGGTTISYTSTIGGSANATAATVVLPVNIVLPAGSYSTGIYTDTTAILRVFNQNTGAIIASHAITPTLLYTATACTINGQASGGSYTVDFSNGTTITIGTQAVAFGTAACNSPTTITLTSSLGASKTAASATTSHQNHFDYRAAVTLNGGSATLNTSSNPVATGPEMATGRITAASTNAPLSVSITSLSPAKPLVAGSYSDTLTVTLSPD